jgi:hypothetical protein
VPEYDIESLSSGGLLMMEFPTQFKLEDSAKLDCHTSLIFAKTPSCYRTFNRMYLSGNENTISSSTQPMINATISNVKNPALNEQSDPFHFYIYDAVQLEVVERSYPNIAYPISYKYEYSGVEIKVNDN